MLMRNSVWTKKYRAWGRVHQLGARCAKEKCFPFGWEPANFAGTNRRYAS
jgi:hypothetical protein